jgi:hypothetical protein
MSPDYPVVNLFELTYPFDEFNPRARFIKTAVVTPTRLEDLGGDAIHKSRLAQVICGALKLFTPFNVTRGENGIGETLWVPKEEITELQ